MGKHGVSEILMNHLLEKLHIIRIELGKTVVDHPCDVGILGSATVKTLLNVFLAILQIFDELHNVSKHEVFV